MNFMSMWMEDLPGTGKKAYCIEQMKKFGFDNTHVLMVGDAPGDLDAAEKNGVFYYPILVGKEKFSWDRF